MHDARRNSPATISPQTRRNLKALALDREAASRPSRHPGSPRASRWLITALVVALGATSFVVANTATDTAHAAATDCWDEYTLTGNTVQRVITPKNVTVGGCTVPTACLDGWSANGLDSHPDLRSAWSAEVVLHHAPAHTHDRRTHHRRQRPHPPRSHPPRSHPPRSHPPRHSHRRERSSRSSMQLRISISGKSRSIIAPTTMAASRREPGRETTASPAATRLPPANAQRQRPGGRRVLVPERRRPRHDIDGRSRRLQHNEHVTQPGLPDGPQGVLGT